MADLTILLPVGPNHPFLEDTLTSVLTDLDDRAHLVCIFDGCEPSESARELIESAGSWTVLPKQSSVASVLNYGLDRIDSRLVSRIDADDLWPAGRLDAQLQVMNANRELVAAGGNAVLINGLGQRTGLLSMGRSRRLGFSMMVRNQVLHPTVVMSREALATAGGYPEVPRVEDYALWLQLMTQGAVAHIGVDWVHYRRHPDQEIARAIPTSSMDEIARARRRLARERGWTRGAAIVTHAAWKQAQGAAARGRARGWSREVMDD